MRHHGFIRFSVGFVIGYALVRSWRVILAALAVGVALVSGVSTWLVTAAVLGVCVLSIIRDG